VTAPSTRAPGQPTADKPHWKRVLLDLPFVGVAICSARDGRWHAVNERLCAMVGYSRDEIAGMGWRQLCHRDDQARGNAALQRLFTGRTLSIRILLRFVRKDGQALPVAVDLSFAKARTGSARHIVALVTEHDARSARPPAQTGEDSEQKLKALVEQSISGIYIIDAGHFTYANPRLAEIFGFAPGALEGRPALDLVDPADRDLVAESIRRRLAGEVTSLKYEFRGIRRDGSRIHIGAHGSVTIIGGRRVIVGTLQDITAAIENQQRRDSDLARLESAMQAAVQTITRIVELRDPYTAGHERRVADLSRLFARELGMDKDRLRGLAIAGGLHDIGKIGVPVEVLVKPMRLSAAEFQVVKDHAAHGHDILRVMDFPWPVADAAHQHHERIDGSGYPQGLKGDKIILEARILAVADVIEAMASHRPYRAAIGLTPALEEIERGAGQIYDSDVAAVALRLCRSDGFRLPA